MKKVKLSDKAIFVINRLGFISISDEIYLDLTAALLSADGAISDYEDANKRLINLHNKK